LAILQKFNYGQGSQAVKGRRKEMIREELRINSFEAFGVQRFILNDGMTAMPILRRRAYLNALLGYKF
jgi:hypothetical protein